MRLGLEIQIEWHSTCIRLYYGRDYLIEQTSACKQKHRLKDRLIPDDLWLETAELLSTIAILASCAVVSHSRKGPCCDDLCDAVGACHLPSCTRSIRPRARHDQERAQGGMVSGRHGSKQVCEFFQAILNTEEWQHRRIPMRKNVQVASNVTDIEKHPTCERPSRSSGGRRSALRSKSACSTSP